MACFSRLKPMASFVEFKACDHYAIPFDRAASVFRLCLHNDRNYINLSGWVASLRSRRKALLKMLGAYNENIASYPLYEHPFGMRLPPSLDKAAITENQQIDCVCIYSVLNHVYRRTALEMGLHHVSVRRQ